MYSVGSKLFTLFYKFCSCLASLAFLVFSTTSLFNQSIAFRRELGIPSTMSYIIHAFFSQSCQFEGHYPYMILGRDILLS